ncbi:MAG TPA: TOBE domain-containing protein, partial [Gemmatimonadaceae bacterium]|nr:TOBE domain-containing protein [Gemmatimonadaceae bacterium]
CGTPEELYNVPVSREVASFIGRGAIVPAVDNGATAATTIGGKTLELRVARSAGATNRFDSAFVVLRPDALRLTEPGESNAWPGRILNRRFAGGVEVYRVQLAEDVAVEVESTSLDRREDETVGVSPRDRAVPIVPG